MPGQDASAAHVGARRPLAVRRGLWYRIHPADSVDLDQGKAQSVQIDERRPGQAGLSAFASPHHLLDYVRAMDWGDRDYLHGYDDGITRRRVVAFHGKEIGRGAEDEPLIRPEPDPSCCGQAVHVSYAWPTFVRGLSETPKPASGRWRQDVAAGTAADRRTGARGRHRRQAPRSYGAPVADGTRLSLCAPKDAQADAGPCPEIRVAVRQRNPAEPADRAPEQTADLEL